MKISVIVPVYNVQKYLEECVQSILNQTFSDFELLLIDDGSTDQSGAIAEKLAENDSRIRVFHKENGGLSDARNYGIDRAEGDYLTFIDSDDYVDLTYFEKLVGLIGQFDADISCVSVYETAGRNTDGISKGATVGKFSGIEAIINSLLRHNIGISACGKLFFRNLFNEIRFPKGELYEDLLTLPYVFEKCKTVAYSSAKLYLYYQRPGSITNTRITEKHMHFFNNTIQLVERFDHYGKRIHEAFIVRIVGESINRFAEVLLFCPDYSDKIKRVKNYMGQYWKESLSIPILPHTTKIQIEVLRRSTLAYYILFKPFKRLKRMFQKKGIS